LIVGNGTFLKIEKCSKNIYKDLREINKWFFDMFNYTHFGNLYLKYKMSTSYKSIEKSGKVMLRELCDAQISAELTFEVSCSIVDLRVQG
jgi:hypothetical protein